MKVDNPENRTDSLNGEISISPNSSLHIKLFLALCLFLIIGIFGGIYFFKGDALWKYPIAKINIWIQHKGFQAFSPQSGIIGNLMLLPGSLLQSTEVPQLIVDLKFKHLQKLKAKRKKAVARGILIQEKDDFVPAKIRFKDKNIKVKLRLKGDWIDHLMGKKWSLRIHTKGKSSILGMRRFSLQAPWTRAFQGEILYFETLRHVGVLAPRYFFVDVIINGDNIGLMAFEEHFSKELLEFNQRKESVIVRFDESLMWATKAETGEFSTLGDHRTAQIDAFSSSRVAKSKKLSQNFSIAVGLLRSFKSGKLLASEIFDAEQMGKFLAVADFWGSIHTTVWHNQRFTLNPVTLKLEPIGFDANITADFPQVNDRNAHHYPNVADMLTDPKIFAVYAKTLEKLALEIKNGVLLDKLKKVEKKYSQILRSEYFLLDAFPLELLVERANKYLAPDNKYGNVARSADFLTQSNTLFVYNKNSFKNTPPNYPHVFHANIIQDANRSYLEILNAIPYEIEIQSIRWTLKGNLNGPAFETTEALSFPFSLRPFGTPNSLFGRRIYFSVPKNSSALRLEVTANIENLTRRYKERAKKYYAPLQANPFPHSTIEKQLSQHPFLSLNKQKNTLTVQSGKWLVKGSIIVPSNVSLVIEKGTTLQFGAKEGIISQGTLLFQGTKDNPILLEGVTTQKGDLSWQGMAVIQAKDKSKLSYTVFRNTTGLHRPKWDVTAGVTFYKSDVDLMHCSFLDNATEDALNIVHSKFYLKEVHIKRMASDGFDSDFSEGTVEGGLFVGKGKIGGGDGVDVSGSKIIVRGTSFSNISDKALSVGEKSEMIAENVTIKHSGVGAASKDGSHLTIRNSTITSAINAGLMAYVKKPEYKNARIDAENIVFSQTTIPVKAQKGNPIMVNGLMVTGEELDIKGMYQTIMKPSVPR